MSADSGGLYIVRDQGEGGGVDDESAWLTPEPADDVIVSEIVAASDLERDEIEPLDDHVEFETLRALLASDEGVDEVTFDVGGYSIAVDHDGTVAVTDAE